MMELIRARLANDERPLKRVLKAFYRLAEPDPLPSSLDAGAAGAVEVEDPTDRLQRLHHEFLIELQSLARTLESTKGDRITRSTAQEVAALEKEMEHLEEESAEQQRKIEVLEGELERAKRERREKMEYEEVGREVRRYGDRIQSAECVPSPHFPFPRSLTRSVQTHGGTLEGD